METSKISACPWFRGRPYQRLMFRKRNKSVFEEAWNTGGGFRFMFGTSVNCYKPEPTKLRLNSTQKIRQIVKDPETARKLTPTDLYKRRFLIMAITILPI